MKVIGMHIKSFCLVISSIMLLQSCSIYRSQSSSIDEAVTSGDKVLVLNDNLERFRFKRLVIEKDSLFGITKKNSREAKRLSQLVNTPYYDHFIKIHLPEKDIYEIRRKNKSLSTVLTIAIPVSAFALAIILAGDPFEDTSIWSD
ncbi:hypothetical protein SAMN04487906_2222 [Zhouia amylolytica]|nr:hypothetical protein SAMN04487906_2222 [Zhouia amylolytica]